MSDPTTHLSSEPTRYEPSYSQLQAELETISLELARRELHEAIRYWLPNGGQEKFLQEIFRPGSFVVVNGSGNGGGKTYSIVALAAAVMWPMLAPSCMANEPLIKNWPHPKRARIISTPKEVEEIGSIQTTIQELFPKGRYETIRKGKSYPSQFKTDTGWIVDVMTYEQDKSEFAGPSIGLTIFNEPMPQDIWVESVSRTRKGGIILVAMTSLYDHPWVVDGILGKADGKNIRVVYCDQEENCIEHGKNGRLHHDQLQKILEQYDEDEREARKTGKPLSMSGRIFKNFDRSVHVAKEEIRPVTNGMAHYMVVDPAIGKPLAILWAQVDATGTVQVYDEWPEFNFEGSKDSNLTVKDYAELIRQREAARSIQTRILDRHFGNVRRTLGGLTLKQEFSEAGLDFIDSYHVAENVAEVETGVMKVKEYLRYDKAKEIDALNRPRLIVSPTCKNTIAALERWGRDPKTSKPKEEYKDFADLVRYLTMSNPEVETTRPWDQSGGASYGVGT